MYAKNVFNIHIFCDHASKEDEIDIFCTLFSENAIEGKIYSKMILLMQDKNEKIVVVVVNFVSNSPLVGPGTVGGMPSVGVFLRDPSQYLCEFRGKPRKTPNG